MHPQSAGLKAQLCDLDYAALTVAQLQQRLRACADGEPGAPAGAQLYRTREEDFSQQQVMVKGFSTKTCLPAWAAAMTWSACIRCGDAMATAFTTSSKDTKDMRGIEPSLYRGKYYRSAIEPKRWLTSSTVRP